VPAVPATPGITTLTPAYERFPFVYEDGSHNAEGLMVAPDGTIYVVTKVAPGTGGRVAATGPSTIYRLPASLSAASTAVATPTEPQSEGIDCRADGLGFITSGEGAGAPIVQTGCAP
jgi:hypothetical protein